MPGRITCIPACLLLAGSFLHVQSSADAMPTWQKAAGGHQAFEVASVRQSSPGAPNKGFGLLNPFLDMAPKTNLFSANLRVSDYVGFAYRINDPSQLRPVFEQMPSWSQTELYDIEARSETTPTRDQLRLMVRTVLEERFKLKIHTESRQQPVYDLVFDKAGKPGPELRPHAADTPCEERPAGVGGGILNAPPPPFCGTDVYRIQGRYHLRMIDVTMEQAALALSGACGFLGGMENLPVHDQTGLPGRFDVDLEFLPARSSDAPESEIPGVPFPDALKKQLGLKLTRTPAPSRSSASIMSRSRRKMSKVNRADPR